MSDFFPVDWEMSALGSCVEDCRSGASLGPSDFKSSGVPVIPKKSVQRGGILVFDDEKEYCSHAFSANNENCIINSEYVVATLRDLVPSGPSIGLIGELKGKGDFLLAQGVYGLRLNEKLDKQYLAQLSNLGWYRARMREMMVGSTQVHIRVGEFLENVIPIPPLPEQKKIAEILSGIDQLIKCAKEKNAKLKVARDALIQNLREEDTLDWVSLSEISDFVTSGSRGWSQYYSDKGARFVRIGNLSRHSIDLNSDPKRWQLVEPPKGAEGERTKLQEQDILISITADLGICCIYSSSLGDAYINQHIALVRIGAKQRNYARQVAYYICSDHCQEQIRSMNDSGAKAGLNLDSIRKVQVPLIEGGNNNKFVQSIDSLQDAIMRNTCQLQQLAKAKNALSLDLLSGRKRVSV
jgi:restriction endonuclease S subunit